MSPALPFRFSDILSPHFPLQFRGFKPLFSSSKHSPGPLPGSVEDAQLALDLHNQKRHEISASVNQPRRDLRWNDRLAADASSYAQHLVESSIFQHSDAPDVGENLYMALNHGSMGEAVKAWLAEEKYYAGGPVGHRTAKAAHYTQCIWPGTTDVGVGFAKKGRRVVVVARYWPQGNILGESALRC